MEICSLDCDDTLITLEFWLLNERYYNIPKILVVPNDVNEHTPFEDKQRSFESNFDEL
jgi:hypothetical protein